MRSFRRAVLIGAPAYWSLFYFAHIQAVQPWGQGWLFRVASATLLLIPLVIAVATVFAVVALFRKQVRDSFLGVAIVLLSLGAIRAFKDVEWFFRGRAVRRVVEDIAPLTRAIHAYTTAEGHPPPNLQALVPRYIASIPATGLGAYPKFDYRVGATAPPDEQWALFIPTSLGILNWDVLLYLPSGRYPREGWGGSLERFADWAYVHE